MLEPWVLSRSRVKKWLVHRLFEDRNFARAKLWRALTTKEADQIRVAGIKAQIIVLPNGLDLAMFPYGERTPSEKKTLLFLGRLHPKKGLSLLIHAWASLITHSGSRGWRLLIVGPDENGHEREIRSLITKLGVERSVSVEGPVEGSRKQLIYRTSHAFVLTSYSEGLPMAVLEALASGLPVLISEACNLPEVVNCGAGWLCGQDLTSVCKGLDGLMSSDDEELHERGLCGRKLVESKYQWPVIARELASACGSLGR
jgi:poly(glycerol-phosphate) alpha-glucosyltransferase